MCMMDTNCDLTSLYIEYTLSVLPYDIVYWTDTDCGLMPLYWTVDWMDTNCGLMSMKINSMAYSKHVASL